MKTLPRYKRNLKIVDNKIYAYDTHVADIDFVYNIIEVLPRYKSYSKTTTKYINYVAFELGLTVKR
jgi:hypothetical protein